VCWQKGIDIHVDTPAGLSPSPHRRTGVDKAERFSRQLHSIICNRVRKKAAHSFNGHLGTGIEREVLPRVTAPEIQKKTMTMMANDCILLDDRSCDLAVIQLVGLRGDKTIEIKGNISSNHGNCVAGLHTKFVNPLTNVFKL
jgi:hypothetical protein